MKISPRGREAEGSMWWIIAGIILVIVFVSFVLDSNSGFPSYIKKILGLKSTTTELYDVCYGKPEGYTCKTKEIPDGACINAMCTFRNSPAMSMDHAKLLFKTTLKQNLEKCKTDAAACTEAFVAVNNILSFVDDGDEGNVYIVIERLESRSTSTSSEFRLNKKLTGVTSLWSSPHVASFTFVGDICFSDSGNRKIIGKLPEGSFILNPEQLANDEAHWRKLTDIKAERSRVCFNSVPRAS
jgi:hypothetical protein